MSGVAFSDPTVQAKLDARIAALRIKPSDIKDKEWVWAIGAIPYPPSDLSIKEADAIFRAAYTYGKQSPQYVQTLAEMQAEFNTQHLGWLGSALATVAPIAVTGITTIIGAKVVTSVLGGTSQQAKVAGTVVGGLAVAAPSGQSPEIGANGETQAQPSTANYGAVATSSQMPLYLALGAAALVVVVLLARRK